MINKIRESYFWKMRDEGERLFKELFVTNLDLSKVILFRSVWFISMFSVQSTVICKMKNYIGTFHAVPSRDLPVRCSEGN